VIGLALFASWKSLARSAREVAVLHTIAVNHEDRFATLWVVDDGPHLWIRAENRQRHWISHVRANPAVELRRNGQTLALRAVFFDSPEARAYVDPLFREKYGVADALRALLVERDTLPIRLDPR
jgi:hypothetical protein